MLLAGLAFAAMGAVAKAGAAHFSSVELVFYRSVFGLVSLGLLARLRRWPLATGHWRLHLSRGSAGVVSLGLYFHCIGHLPLATAVTLNYTSPLFLALISAGTQAEPLRGGLVLALVGGFAGVVTLLEPTLGRDQWSEAAMGLASGVLAAVAYAAVKRLGTGGEPGWRVVFYFTLLSTVATGAVMLVTGARPVTAGNLWIVLGVGATGTLGQVAMTRAYQQGSALVAGTLSYSTVLFSALLGLTLWGEALSAGGWLGMALIAAAGVAAARASARR